jgi:hypothetical protein
MKLWPFRPATRAGQNASAIQMSRPMMPSPSRPAVDIAKTMMNPLMQLGDMLRFP